MELRCKFGNVLVPCTVDQALALLIIEGLPKIDGKKSGSYKLTFISKTPISIQGDFEDLNKLRFSLSDLYKSRPLNGSAIAKWMELMHVPADCKEICAKLEPDTLNIIWQRTLRQRMPITMVLKIFVS